MDPVHPVPAQRAADADRESAAQALRVAGADGRLTLEEMEHRLGAVFAARTHPEISALLVDLGGAQQLTAVRSAPTPARRSTHQLGAPEVARTITILGENTREGAWRPAADSRVITVMGETTIDLGEADLSQPITEMRVITVMGSTRIDVPDGVNVHVTKVTLLGENRVDLPSARSDPGAPELHIRLISILGEAKVRLSRVGRRAGELGA
jgi:hypothetical protein